MLYWCVLSWPHDTEWPSSEFLGFVKFFVNMFCMLNLLPLSFLRPRAVLLNKWIVWIPVSVFLKLWGNYYNEWRRAHGVQWSHIVSVLDFESWQKQLWGQRQSSRYCRPRIAWTCVNHFSGLTLKIVNLSFSVWFNQIKIEMTNLPLILSFESVLLF